MQQNVISKTSAAQPLLKNVVDTAPPNTSLLPPLREVIRAHNLRAEKSLGQNFLLDQNLTDKIIRLSGSFDGVTAIEIGPGPGGLTRSLLASPAAKVIAVEFDLRSVAAISDLHTVYGDRLAVVHGDALKTDITTLTPKPRAIVSNLPYNISTVLLVKWLEQIRADHSTVNFMTLMFQKEVADRLLASPHSKTYGRLTVMAQWLCTLKKLFELPPSAFTPPPKIKSTVLQFTPKILPANAPSFATMEMILAAAFNQRRKMIRSSLSNYAAAVEAANIDPTLRAEDVPVEDFVRLALCVEGKI